MTKEIKELLFDLIKKLDETSANNNAQEKQDHIKTPPYPVPVVIGERKRKYDNSTVFQHKKAAKVIDYLKNDYKKKHVLVDLHLAKNIKSKFEALDLLVHTLNGNNAKVSLVYEMKKNHYISLIDENLLNKNVLPTGSKEYMQIKVWNKEEIMQRNILLSEIFSYGKLTSKSVMKKNHFVEYLEDLKQNNYDTLSEKIIAKNNVSGRSIEKDLSMQ